MVFRNECWRQHLIHLNERYFLDKGIAKARSLTPALICYVKRLYSPTTDFTYGEPWVSVSNIRRVIDIINYVDNGRYFGCQECVCARALAYETRTSEEKWHVSSMENEASE